MRIRTVFSQGVYLLNGRSLVLHEDLCNGCGRCIEVCPHAVFQMTGRNASIAARERCMECGACRMNCARGALAVDSGVGCAAAVLNEMRGKGATCDCDRGCA